MKTILLTALLLLTLVRVNAQHFEAQSYVQETALGLQKGYGVRYISPWRMKFGIFLQSNNNLSLEEGVSNYPFTGIEVSYPISSCGKISMYGNVKGGLVNHQFFAITPEIETVWNFSRFVSLGIGTGVRVREAAISGKIIIKPF